MPSLSALRSSAREALTWLQRSYWDQQADFLQRIQQERDDTKRLVDTVLRKYLDVQRRYAQWKKLRRHATPEAERALTLRRNRLVKGLVQAASTDTVVLTDAILPALCNGLFGEEGRGANFTFALWYPILRSLRNALPLFSDEMLSFLISTRMRATRTGNILFPFPFFTLLFPLCFDDDINTPTLTELRL
jgi:hypothetical protein